MCGIRDSMPLCFNYLTLLTHFVFVAITVIDLI